MGLIKTYKNKNKNVLKMIFQNQIKRKNLMTRSQISLNKMTKNQRKVNYNNNNNKIFALRKPSNKLGKSRKS